MRRAALRGQHTVTNQSCVAHTSRGHRHGWKPLCGFWKQSLKKKFLKGYIKKKEKPYVGARSESQCTMRVKRSGWEALARNVKLRRTVTVPFRRRKWQAKPSRILTRYSEPSKVTKCTRDPTPRCTPDEARAQRFPQNDLSFIAATHAAFCQQIEP